MNEYPKCNKCEDSNDVIDPGGEYWWCSHCNHDINGEGNCVTEDCSTCENDDSEDSDESDSDEVEYPECQKCGDSNDVIDPGGPLWWCNHCKHAINEEGNCRTLDCSTCENDDSEDSDERDIDKAECPVCQKCGDSNDVSDPGGENWWCSHCKHTINIKGNFIPDCQKCGDSNDVSDRGGRHWWCSHCKHDIDREGNCLTENCSTCEMDDSEDSDESDSDEVEYPECRKCGDSNDVSDPGGVYWWCSHCKHDIDEEGNCVTEDCKLCDEELITGDEPYYLFFDTETTGLPKNWDAPINQFDNWPRIVQIAWLLYDSEGNEISKNEFIILPDGFSIPKNASDVHGITTAYAFEVGEKLNDVLLLFEEHCKLSKYLIAHNINFDSKVLGSEFLRILSRNPIQKLELLCTMKNSTQYCRINGRYGEYKWPTLSELHTKLFGYDFDKAHDALADIEATAKCFWKMRRLNLI
jgi:DNA polymerase III epsilon subunit-like protein